MTMISLLLSSSARRSCSKRRHHLAAVFGRHEARSFSAQPDRLSRALYRQLLQWCSTRQKIDPSIPLSLLVAPVHLTAPAEVDSYRCELLAHNFYEERQSASPEEDADAADVRWARKLLPSRAQVKPTQLTAPIDSISDLKNLFGVIYRLNRRGKTEYQKERITAAFEALKSLNQLTGGLDSIHSRREQHADRDGVKFRVGQVVQNKHERWRGIIAAWERSEPSDSKTSLTTKAYTVDDDFSTAGLEGESSEGVAATVKYDIILDAGDAHTMGSSSGWSNTLQSNLIPVTDTALIRIRSNTVDDYFTRFDAHSQSFVPNNLLAYEYPADRPDDASLSQSLPEETVQLCNTIVTGVQELAARLERCILDETSCATDRKFKLLSDTQAELARIASGDIVPNSMSMRSPDGVSPLSTAALHLRALLNLTLETMEVMFQRRTAKEHKGKLLFSIGDIVHHKMFQFRGVVVAWDPKPTVDVTRWDGLGHVENPMDLPFYHVIPDQGDCIEVFGGERQMRYVCEENLEECADNRKLLDVDLQPEWEYDSSNGSYIPPAELRFKYGDDLKDDGATERCLKRLLDEISQWHLSARESTSSNDDETLQKLSLDNLHKLLLAADNLHDAMAVQESIKEIRNTHARPDLRWQLEKAVSDMMGGKSEEARATLLTLVEEDPEYAEAWNKLATTEFLAGNSDKSLEATERALELDPLHFQALNGLGLVYFQQEEYQKASESFRKSLAIDPWSAVPSKLSVSIDLLAQNGETENTEGSS